MKKFNLLLDLSTLLGDDDTLVSEIQLAENQPLNYMSQFSGALQERGIDKAIPTLPWVAMVDALARRDLLIELDWKDDPSILIETALKLLEEHSDYENLSKHLFEIEPFIDEDIEEFLPQLNSELLKFEVQLGWFDIDSDSYPLTILPSAKVIEAKRLALESGYGRIKS